MREKRLRYGVAMPKHNSDKPQRTSAMSSEVAKDRPIRPSGKRLKAIPKPCQRPEDSLGSKLTLDDDGLEIVERAGQETISLLSQQTTHDRGDLPTSMHSAVAHEAVMFQKVDIAIDPVRSSQELKKSASGTSQTYWQNCSEPNSDDLAEMDRQMSLNQSAPDSSASAPSIISVSSTMDSSSSVLGKRKATDAHGPPKLKAAKQIEHTSNLDPEDPFGPLYGSTLENTCPEVKLTEGVVIASDKSFEKALDMKGIPYMSRYEIARLHSIDRIQFCNVSLDALDPLCNKSNAYAAPITQDIVMQKVVVPEPEPTQFGAAVEDEKAAKSPWSEFDTEIEARSADPDAGLGCRSNSSYYGGKVYFLAKLKYDSSKGKEKFKIVLEKPVLGPSYRFARKFGSHSFLRVSVSAAKKVLRNSNCLLDFFRRPFFLMDRVYRACFAKDTTVVLFLTNERIINGQARPPSPQYKPGYFDGKMSLLDFINWHNPLKFNNTQAAAKWAARFALGFSNSVPALKLKPEQIENIGDVPSSTWNGEGKLPAEHDMTDGNGLANCVLLQEIRSRLELEDFPSVVQCRLGGAKGTLALHSSGRFDDSQTEPKAYKRPSQDKIKYDPEKPLDPAMLIVDLLRTSHMQTPARLSTETITNLAENGVPTSVFMSLMEAAMKDLSDALTAWDGPDAMYTLFANIAKIGGVITARIAREMGGESRARGYGDRSEDDDSDEEVEFSGADEELFESSLAWFADLISGQPSSLEETVMSLLSSGFEPHTCAVLAEKLEKIHTTQLANLMSKYKITVPMSCSAMVIPDPCNPPVLKEGEVHIKIDRTSGKLNGSASEDVVRGEVLVTRHPCTQKGQMVAIEHPELRHITNTIVFPRVGYRSPASLLGGGDYDGDTVIAIWQPEIVERFKPPSNSFADPPPGFLEENFSKTSQTIQELLGKIGPDNPDQLTLELQNYLIGSLKDDSLVGAYSNMHEVAIYETGYFSKQTIRLAHMFMTIMDAQKSGLVLNPKVRAMDQKLWTKLLWWKKPSKKSKARADDETRIDTSNGPSVKRIIRHDFILDELKLRGRVVEGQLRDNFRFQKSERIDLDPDLAAPFLEAESRANIASERHGCPWAVEELEKLKVHVQSSRVNHRLKLSDNQKSPSRSGSAFSGLPITDRQDILRDLSRQHVLFPLSENIELVFLSRLELCRVRASYSYIHDWEVSSRRFTRFPWDVDHRELCTIKAASLKFEKTVCRKFYDRMNIISKYRTYRK